MCLFRQFGINIFDRTDRSREPVSYTHLILTRSGKIYTCLKIDEVNNLGAARIRIRSLIAAIRVREKKQTKRTIVPASYERVVFTKEMRENYTILCPQMSPIHFELLEPAFNAAGYNPVSYTHLSAIASHPLSPNPLFDQVPPRYSITK